MNRAKRLLVLVALAVLMLSGCTSRSNGEESCSCAAGTTYGGTFYQQYANTSVHAEAPIGKSDHATGCCGEQEPRVTIYSIKGVDPRLAVATRGSDGRTYFNVASGLSERDKRTAARFAKKHHAPG